MNSSEVRKVFLEFFRERGHEVVRSSSLIPHQDPTLLFTNAGMNQFKTVFLGQESREYSRATTCQKCMRAGGKHSDLENVGHTARHHTFFEMLGNFSFGDYFKRDAIAFGWELLTEYYKLPKDKLWVTVYEEDDEAEQLWQEVVGVPKERIVRMGAKDNFWQMADTGPCGPCSEIHIDQGEEAGCGLDSCQLGCDCDRYMELWNLVFMQYDRDEQGKLNPLPKPSIDTGMGLERITAVMQGKLNNFDTDLFAPIIEMISAQTGVSYGKGKDTDASIRVMADHARAAAFLISDGLMPANDGRGYVLRRIIRRAARHARLLGKDEPVLFKIIESVADSMGDVYPELRDELDRAQKVLQVEEDRFARTLQQGMRILDDLLDELKKANDDVIPGREVFKLYDTFGFPVDLVRDIAHDSGYKVDEVGFHEAMEAQRERARASWVGEDEGVAAIYREVHSEIGDTEFTGYGTMEDEGVVRSIIKDGKAVNELKEGQEGEIVLDRTPFYGESGGQVGDTGTMVSETTSLEVLDTKKPLESMPVHVVKVKRGTLKVWDRLSLKVDTDLRSDTMRNHTATHLLQAALRSVLGDHVKQAGSLVEPGRYRFDFTHFSSVSREELDAIEDLVNKKVMENIPLNIEVKDIEEALAGGAMALFGEKYGDRVRIVNVPGFSSEFCGGTHVHATGDIGPFVIESEGSVASGIRRLEGSTGRVALARLKEKERQLKSIGELLKTSDSPEERVRTLLEELKSLQREQEKLKGAAMKDASSGLIDQVKEINGVKVLAVRVDGINPKDLRGLADQVRDRMGSGVLVLASVYEDQGSLLATVTKDLTKKFKAGDILKQVAQAAGGRGGGKPEMAQGGTKELDKLDSALESVYDIVREG